MKRFAFFLMLLGLVVFAVGCQKPAEQPSTPIGPPAPSGMDAPAEEPATEAPGDELPPLPMGESAEEEPPAPEFPALPPPDRPPASSTTLDHRSGSR